MEQGFFPHTVPGLVWLMALLTAVAIAGIGAIRRGNVTPALFVSGVASGSWIFTRAITAWAPDSAVPLLVGAGALVCAIIVLRQMKTSKFSVVVASLYLIIGAMAFIANLGLVWLANVAPDLNAGFSVETALWIAVEIPGYILLMLITGYGGIDVGTGRIDTSAEYDYFGRGDYLRGGVDRSASIHHRKVGDRNHVRR